MHDDQEITVLIKRTQEGSVEAQERLFAVLCEELRSTARNLMKHEAGDHTLQATALINEACINLLKAGSVNDAQDRRYLIGAANQAMRRILIDHARARSSAKRGRTTKKESLDDVMAHFESKAGANYEVLHAALDLLDQESPRQREIVEHRFLAELTVPETAAIMGISERTIEREWRLARAKLFCLIQQLQKE